VQAALVFAQQEAARYQHLAQTGYGSVQNAQRTTSQLNQQQAALGSAQATLRLARRQIESLKAQRANAVASLEQAKAQRDQAQLNLSYTTVTADQAGRVANLTAAVGQFAQPGTNLTMFVPDEIWVTANFKENQLDAMRPGQPVTLEIDAYPERTIHGHIDSVQPGSGTAFSLLPVQNATGNYVKIVQRVPVKIIMDDPPGRCCARSLSGWGVVTVVLRAAEGVAMSAGATRAGVPAAASGSGTNPWLIAVLVAVAVFMEVLDTTIANVRTALYRRRSGG
jgi:membrane fusion protein, multidrug efflux system